jgi:hypothetical protein
MATLSLASVTRIVRERKRRKKWRSFAKCTFHFVLGSIKYNFNRGYIPIVNFRLPFTNHNNKNNTYPFKYSFSLFPWEYGGKYLISALLD